jgi:hypothetical protein
MKTSIKLFALGMILMGFGVSANAQSTASATASANIITPIAISKTVDMNFGNVAVSATVAGTVVLDPAGARTRTAGVTLPNSVGTVTAASFTLSGDANRTFAITLPANNTIRIGAAGATMLVNTFTSTPSGTGALSGGALTLTVGATLNVDAAQAVGLYTSVTPFDVTVNYN